MPVAQPGYPPHHQNAIRPTLTSHDSTHSNGNGRGHHASQFSVSTSSFLSDLASRASSRVSTPGASDGLNNALYPHSHPRARVTSAGQVNIGIMSSGVDQPYSDGAGMGVGSVGRGTVLDPDALGNAAGGLPEPVTGGGRGAGWSGGPLPSRSHYHLTRQEILKGVANRFVHSTAYLYFYGAMALASALTVVLSLIQDCPGSLFYSLEFVINLVLISEVVVRVYAFGKQFWKSTFNVIDLCLVLLCAITLLVLFFSHDCSPYRRPPIGGGDGDGDSDPNGRGGRGEELLDSLVLIVRNVVQLVRLLSVVRRSGSNVASRVPAIDLNAAAARGYGFDVEDLEEESLLARQRMAAGGDPAARSQFGAGLPNVHGAGGGQGGAREERIYMDDDDDEEL